MKRQSGPHRKRTSAAISAAHAASSALKVAAPEKIEEQAWSYVDFGPAGRVVWKELVRDLDLDKIRVVRDRWAFYRDRRPDAYDELVAR